MCSRSSDRRAAPRVLVAEDNPINIEIMTAYLAAGGYSSTFVRDGQAAIEAVVTGEYDIVLMDIQMPVVDGMMATKGIRALGGHAGEIPIVAVTAIHADVDAAFLRFAGLDAWVAKPVDREQLYAVIDRLTAGFMGRDAAPE